MYWPAVTLPANLARKLLASRPSLFCTWRILGGHIRMCRTVCRTLRSSWYKCWTEGSMALKRWIVYVSTGTIIESQWQLLTFPSSPNQICYRRSYSESILCNLHASQLPGRLFTEPSRLWVYHGKRMSRPKKCHRNLPDEVSLKCNWWNVPLAVVFVEIETSAAAYSVNARQTVSATNAKTLILTK